MSDSQSVTWSIIDLGGVVGTFINGINVESNTPHNLNCGDLIGVGCPENKSCREKGKETFVFKLHLSKTSDKEKDQDGSMEEVKTSSSTSSFTGFSSELCFWIFYNGFDLISFSKMIDFCPSKDFLI